MWTPQVDLISAFCVSAIVVFLASLGLMMLVVYLRKPRPDPVQSQGHPCDVIYAPTTVQSAGNTDAVKPLLISLEKIEANGIYPTKELTPLKQAMNEP